jgi:hypothetical protein
MKQDLHIIPEGHINATSITTACRRRSGQQESRGMISGRGEAAGMTLMRAASWVSLSVNTHMVHTVTLLWLVSLTAFTNA